MANSFRLSKDEIARRDEIISAMREKYNDLDDEIRDYNEKLAALKAPVEAALEAYNATLSDARAFAEDIAGQADSDISDKSEKWQEGERGQAATAWKDEWEALSFDSISIDFPDEIDFSESSDEADTLENASEEMSE
jgi:hypothetical protein